MKTLFELWQVKPIKKLRTNYSKFYLGRTNYSKFYLGYFSKLEGEYNNTYHNSVGKKTIDADYYTLTYEIETNPIVPKFKIGERGESIFNENIFSKGYINNQLKAIFVIDSVLKTNPWTNKIKYLNAEIIIETFYEK